MKKALWKQVGNNYTLMSQAKKAQQEYADRHSGSHPVIEMTKNGIFYLKVKIK